MTPRDTGENDDAEEEGVDAAEPDPEALKIAAALFDNAATEESRITRPSLPANWPDHPRLTDDDGEGEGGRSLRFMLTDSTYLLGPLVSGMPGAKVGPVPIIRLFGVTIEGHSVMCDVHGFIPYFYIAAPPHFTASHCEGFRINLNRRLVDTQRETDRTHADSVLNVSIEQKQSVMGFKPAGKDGRVLLSPFIRIDLASPRYVPTLRKILESGFDCPPFGHRQYLCYEANIPFVLRWMIDYDVVGCGWLEIKRSHLLRTVDTAQDSTCQIEVRVAANHLAAIDPTSALGNRIAPLRICSFDIECAGRKGHFPSPDQDPIIQIASVVKQVGDEAPLVRALFTWKPSGSIPGAKIYCFKDEREMLVQWCRFVHEVDPDIFTGYNTDNFDWNYLIERSRVIKATEFAFLSRLRLQRVRLKNHTISSSAIGTRETRTAAITGRLQFDMFQVITRQSKMRSYTLNNVAAANLGEQKEDVHHSMITQLWMGTPDDRRRLASYCIKDAVLPMRLLEKLMVLVNYVEMARVTGVPFSYLLERGQSIRVMSQLFRFARRDNYLIPTERRESSQGGDGDGYTGAVVIQPKKGFHPHHVATLDFASLYPSIMMAHNLCYTTLLKPEQVAVMDPNDYVVSPPEENRPPEYFVRSHMRRGLLPQILDALLAARSRAKRELAAETDPFRKAVFDGRQLALKVSANSVYGFTGASKQGQLPCVAISSTVTAFGRQMIEQTKSLVMERYTINNGYEADADVIYGDTDSVMVKFGSTDMTRTMELARDAAAHISTTFAKPIKLEFEKVYYPYLLLSKKRYAGLLWTKPEKYDKIDCKGIESVRRDNCRLVKDLIEESLHYILIRRDTKAAENHVKSVIQDLKQNRVDLSLLVISKTISKESYKVKQAHTELAARLRKREPSTAPGIGDRVPYVIIRGRHRALTYEKSEDPLYVLQHNLPIDINYYIEHQLKQPLCRMFKNIMPDPKELFTGSHARSLAVTCSRSIGIGSFAVREESCLGCRVALTGDQKTLCDHCKPNAAMHYIKRVETLREHETAFHALWTQCQGCQGSIHERVICENSDCPIFYRRTKAALDVKEATEVLERFSIDW